VSIHLINFPINFHPRCDTRLSLGAKTCSTPISCRPKKAPVSLLFMHTPIINSFKNRARDTLVLVDFIFSAFWLSSRRSPFGGRTESKCRERENIYFILVLIFSAGCFFVRKPKLRQFINNVIQNKKETFSKNKRKFSECHPWWQFTRKLFVGIEVINFILLLVVFAPLRFGFE
jgi:hypothetical protein